MAKQKNPTNAPTKKVALCYIRQSYTRDDDDTNSPDRQRANIQRIVERHGWQAEWYEDVGGHKSGQSESNRPAWLNLKERLGDDDIVALIANDLSRLHRNVANISSLVELLQTKDISLVIAASDIEIDTSTLMGQMFAQFSGLMDAYYAKDIAAKAKDSIAHRKRQGKVIGIVPFGTARTEEGYLKPSEEGAWLLSNGTYVKGIFDEPPQEDALWRSYYQCAKYILDIYAENLLGMEKVAYRLADEGWPYRDRWGNPRPITRDDVRRVVSNWPAYGGIVVDKRAKDRRVYENNIDPDTIPFIEDRAVMPIEFLRKIALIRQNRTIKPKDHGLKRKAYHYPLSVILRCSHCEDIVEREGNPNLRSTLHGNLSSKGVRRYRHKLGVKCGCKNRSVPCEDLEDDFIRLVRLMTIDPEMVDMLTEFAIQADKLSGNLEDDNLEEKKQQAIALARRRINAAVVLFDEGRIDFEAYRTRIEKHERTIAHWQARTTETEKVALDLVRCVQSVNEIVQLWDTAESKTKQKLARNLFEYLVYDLDTRRILRWKLKPWAERFVTLRTAIYDDVLEVIKAKTPDFKVGGNELPPRGFEPRFQP